MNSSRSAIALIFLVALSMLGACDLLSSHRERAEELLASGDLPGARIEATNAVEDKPNDAEAHLLLGRILTAQGDYVTADRALKNARAVGGDPGRIDAQRARVLVQSARYAIIMDELKPDPSYPGEALALVHWARGLAQLAREEPDEAKRSLQAALQAVPDHPEALLAQAKLAHRENDRDRALQLVERVVVKHPRYADAWAFKASLLQAQRRIEEAILAYQQAATRDPGNIAHDLAAAELLMKVERFDVAQRHITLARKRAPNSVVPFHAQALLHFRRKQYDRALEVAQQILKRKPDHQPAVMLTALARFERGELNQVESLLGPLVHAPASSASARKLLGRAQARMGNLSKALETLAPLDRESPADYEALTLLGEIHARAKDYDKAAAYYERAAKLRPNRPEALARAGVAMFSGGNLQDGLETLEKAAAAGQSNTAVDITLSLLLLQQAEFRRALEVARRIEKNQPESPLGHTFSGLALMGLKDTAGARERLERALAIAPAFWLAAANLARLDLAAGNPDGARARIEQVIASDKQSIEAITALWRITGDRGKFVELLEVARSADPNALAPRLALARAYVEQKLGSPALAVAREAFAIAPKRPESLEVLGLAQVAAGHPAEALTTFRDLAALAPESPRVHVRLAQTLLALDDVTKAEAAYGRALAVRAGDLEALLGLARLHARTGRLDQALKTAEQLQQRYPRSSIGHELAGDVLMANERYPEATKAFVQAYALQPSSALVIKQHAATGLAGMPPPDELLEQWLARNPHDNAVRFHMATRCYLAGRFDEAIRHYGRIVQSDPLHVLALNNLAATYLKTGNAEALSVAQAAYRLKPDDANILDTYGMAQLRFGKAGDAVELLRKALSRNSDSVQTRVHYALALAKTGDRSAARKMLQTALSTDSTLVLDKEAKALLH